MADDQIRKCVIDELRKAHGEPLSAEELFERCGGVKATNHNLESFRSFIGQQCSRAVKPVHDTGDENSMPKYALHVDYARKTGTLKRKTTRSKSQSSSRGGTPDGTSPRFNPRTDGFAIFCHIVRKLSASSSDRTINWNAIRNQYRKETGRHLLTEELNNMCGTINMTKNELLTTYLSTVVEILDSRGQIVRPASLFNSKTPSPVASRISPEDRDFSPVTALSEEVRAELAEDEIRRQNIVEQLRKSGVYVIEDEKTSAEERTPLPSQSSELAEDETSKISPREVLQTPESDQTSFISVNQTLETSGEVGYTTGDDGTPESDISLDYTADFSALNSTPRHTHEITLCNVDDSTVHSEKEDYTAIDKIEEEKDIIADTEHTEEDQKNLSIDSYDDVKKEEDESELSEVPENAEKVDAEEKPKDLKESLVEEIAHKNFYDEEQQPAVIGESEDLEEVIKPQIIIEEIPVEEEQLAEEQCTEIPVILITEPEDEEEQDEPIKEVVVEEGENVVVDVEFSGDDIAERSNFTDEDEVYVCPPIMDANIEESAEETGSSVYIPKNTPVKERKLMFEAAEKEDCELHIAEVVVNADIAVKEQVEKFEHLQEENLNESRVSHFSEDAGLEAVDVKELVHELEHSFIEEQPTVDNDLEAKAPSNTHVLEKVHKLEHEFDESLPTCEEYVLIAEHEKEQLEAAGDAARAVDIEEKSVTLGPAGDKAATCDVEMVRKEETSVETVSVTIEPAEVVAQIDASVSEQTNTVITSTVIVDVIPRKNDEPKLSTSDSWENAFVVASGSATSGMSVTAQAVTSVGSHVTAVREFFREVDELEKNVGKEPCAKEKREVEDLGKVEDLDVTQELPTLPPVTVGDENVQAKNLQLAKKRGRAIVRRRRLMDCCTVL